MNPWTWKILGFATFAFIGYGIDSLLLRAGMEYERAQAFGIILGAAAMIPLTHLVCFWLDHRKQ